MSLSYILTIAAAWIALMLLGGGLYESLVVDPFWPKRPDIIQPNRGGISRRRFWIPIHTLFELLLISALIAAWPAPTVRRWLLVALISHIARRIWSAFDFIPKALAFERAELGAVTEISARKWTHRSIFRLPLSVLTCAAMVTALVRVARV